MWIRLQSLILGLITKVNSWFRLRVFHKLTWKERVNKGVLCDVHGRLFMMKGNFNRSDKSPLPREGLPRSIEKILNQLTLTSYQQNLLPTTSQRLVILNCSEQAMELHCPSYCFEFYKIHQQEDVKGPTID